MSVVINGILLDERDRLQRLIQVFDEKLKEYPKGSVKIMKVRGHEYAYLVYREKGKVKNEYLGSPDKPEVQEIVLRANKRKSIKAEYREVMIELKQIERMLGGRKAI